MGGSHQTSKSIRMCRFLIEFETISIRSDIQQGSVEILFQEIERKKEKPNISLRAIACVDRERQATFQITNFPIEYVSFTFESMKTRQWLLSNVTMFLP